MIVESSKASFVGEGDDRGQEPGRIGGGRWERKGQETGEQGTGSERF